MSGCGRAERLNLFHIAQRSPQWHNSSAMASCCHLKLLHWQFLFTLSINAILVVSKLHASASVQVPEAHLRCALLGSFAANDSKANPSQITTFCHGTALTARVPISSCTVPDVMSYLSVSWHSGLHLGHLSLSVVHLFDMHSGVWPHRWLTSM